MGIRFLNYWDVLQIHSDQIRRYGGDSGIRDLGLLESAVVQAEMTYDSNYLHNNIYEMGAAYLFHIVNNHPFVDGNKRTGAAVGLVFLDWNGIEVNLSQGSLLIWWYQLLQEMRERKKLQDFSKNIRPEDSSGTLLY